MSKSDLTAAEAIRARRSIKTFKSDPIPEPVLQELLSLMQDAPSSWNFQPTRVVMIRSKEQKEALAAAAWGQKQILEAPVTFVFAVSIRGWEKNMDEILKQALPLVHGRRSSPTGSGKMHRAFKKALVSGNVNTPSRMP